MTFNGDNFDLHYLWRRAQVLGMRKDEVPITMGREIALMPTAIHFDLYKFFHNHAIQIYAFSHAYKETSLNAISESLLKMKKIELDRPINDLDYLSLASYCFRDSLITLRLTQENSNVAMHLTTLIMRISRLSMEDATRQGSRAGYGTYSTSSTGPRTASYPAGRHRAAEGGILEHRHNKGQEVPGSSRHQAGVWRLLQRRRPRLREPVP
jgi:DNA polymerase elongation subunit (family B)